MSVWAIIPVKPFIRAKSRLADVLSPEERQQLAETMLRHVIAVAREVPEVSGTLVISRDPKALAIARECGAQTVQESGTPELNSALARATSVIASWQGEAVLVLPADLPFVAPEDVAQIVELGRDAKTVVIATDNNEDGTNAMLVRPPGLIPYAYGTGSYRRHVMSAHFAGAKLHVYESERLMIDIDTPEDLAYYQRRVQADSTPSEYLAGN